MARGGFEVKRTGHRDDTGARIDSESSTGITIERVGDLVGGTVEIGRESCQADHSPVGRVFIDGISCRVGVGDGSDVELVDIGQIDGERLS